MLRDNGNFHLVRALITGISGFAGSHLAQHLLEQGDRVLGISRHGRWPADVPRRVSDEAALYGWNLAEQGQPPEAARQAIERFAPEAVYHLAALSIPAVCGRSEPTPLAWSVNVEGTRRLLEFVEKVAPTARVLLVSSNKVYGSVSPENAVVDERRQLNPQNGYGRTKLAAEQLLHEAVQRGLHGLIARSFQHAGPRQDARLMLSEWACQFARRSNDPVVLRTRRARLDLSDVRDVVRAYREIVLHGAADSVYNVGSGVARWSGEVFDLLHQMADPERPVIESRGHFVQEPIADISRLQRDTAWRPEVPIEQTVADTWHYWRHRLAKQAGSRSHGA